MPLPALPPQFTVPPILMYHRVDPDRGADPVSRDLTVTPQVFEAELRRLRSMGLEAIGMAELDRRLRLRLPLGRSVVLTFDDGYADQYRYAVPLLRRYGAGATFYIITGAVGDRKHLSWAQLRAMRREGFDIAAHGRQHDDLSAMSRSEQQAQVEGSVARLTSEVGQVTSYAYPSGRFDRTTLDVVRSAGMPLAVTTDQAFVLPPESRFELWRVRVHGDWSPAEFSAALAAARRERQTARR